jgi:hypothetical protein
VEEFKLPDGGKVLFTGRVLESDLDDHDNCPFCLGRPPAHRGDGEEHNPFPPADVTKGSVDWYESDYRLWWLATTLDRPSQVGCSGTGNPTRERS